MNSSLLLSSLFTSSAFLSYLGMGTGHRHFPLEAEPSLAVKHKHFRLLVPPCLFLQQNDRVCRKVFSRGRSFWSDWWTGSPFCCSDPVAALLPRFSSISLRHLDVTPSLSLPRYNCFTGSTGGSSPRFRDLVGHDSPHNLVYVSPSGKHSSSGVGRAVNFTGSCEQNMLKPSRTQLRNYSLLLLLKSSRSRAVQVGGHFNTPPTLANVLLQ